MWAAVVFHQSTHIKRPDLKVAMLLDIQHWKQYFIRSILLELHLEMMIVTWVCDKTILKLKTLYRHPVFCQILAEIPEGRPYIVSLTVVSLTLLAR